MVKMAAEIKEQQKNIAAMQEIVNTPWRKESELRQMKIDLAALERKIQSELEAIGKPENINDTVEVTEEVAI